MPSFFSLKWDFMNFLPRVTSNHNSGDLSPEHSQDCSNEPLAPGSKAHFLLENGD
jgi:hypothetical protein